MKRVLLLTAVWFCTAPSISRSQTPAHAQADALMADIASAWANREKQAKAIRIRWTEEKITHPAAYAPSESTSKLPSEPQSAVLTATLTLDGDRLRYESSGLNWSESAGKMVMMDELTVSTPEFHEHIFRFHELPYTMAHIRDPKADMSFLADMACGAVIVYRGSLMNAAGFESLGLYEPTNRTLQTNGRTVVELLHESRAAGLKTLFYVDKATDYLPVRLDRFRHQQLVVRLEWDYGAHPRLGQAPKGWIMTVTGPKGEMVRSSRVSVTEVTALSAGDLTTETFQPRCPPNTRVSDSRAGRGVRYVVDEHGVRGPEISDSRVSYSEIEMMKPLTPARWAWPWLLVCLAPVALLLYWRLAVRRKSPTRGVS